MASEKTKLGRLINSQGRNARWLAGKLHVSESYVSWWCSAERPIPLDMISRIAEELGVHEREVVEEEQKVEVA